MHGLMMVSALLIGQSTPTPCFPLGGILPLVRRLSPDVGASNVATNGTQVILASDDNPNPADWPWSWISVELVPESGEIEIGSLPKVLDSATADGLLAHAGIPVKNKATAFSYSVAAFSFGTLQKNMNYRIVVDITAPGSPGCPAVHHPGVVGNFTTSS